MKFYGLFSLRKLSAQNSLFMCWQAFFMGSVNASSCLVLSFVSVRNFLLRQPLQQSTEHGYGEEREGRQE
jgi:hypothetical protein